MWWFAAVFCIVCSLCVFVLMIARFDCLFVCFACVDLFVSVIVGFYC